MEIFDTDDNISDNSNSDMNEIENNTNINRSILLKNRPNGADVICFHRGTEEMMFLYVEKYASRGDPKSILKVIDRFCYSRHWMMHIGDQKSVYLDQAITQVKSNIHNQPLLCLELGSYCGYSSIKIAMELTHPKSMLYSIECNPNCVSWTRRLVEFAGLSDRVTVIPGSLEDSSTIESLKKIVYVENTDESHSQLQSPSQFGLVFIDHDKDKYLSDLLIIEDLHIMRSGCIVVADNILCFGNPSTAYLNHVRNPNGPYVNSTFYEGFIEYCVPNSIQGNMESDFSENDAVGRANRVHRNITSLKDGIEISICK